jgi:hypothetical protein
LGFLIRSGTRIPPAGNEGKPLISRALLTPDAWCAEVSVIGINIASTKASVTNAAIEGISGRSAAVRSEVAHVIKGRY